ncbi:MAG: deoxyribonuclease IV [Euryarchaeota archaeon]|nr:deoxyribonuclease IV [Euryarchaeota archaeon]MDE1837227.1 deoxyribonuclease IV [Euryarchaeota archaeon]MDE1879838.1 deoxyribonuclease IV [Euryarchaeota archaeon]MDE2045169.1 deoxyribonuclease IV [Thermoplasmata archaeon]
MLLGAHISISGGIDQAPVEARKLGCDVMQVFSKNQQQWTANPLRPEVVERFRVNVKEQRIQSVGIHTSYLINLGSPQPSLQERSRAAFKEEIERAEALGATHLIFHPGAHTGSGEAAGLASIASGVRWALEATGGCKVRVLLEIAAGQGTTLGCSFEQLAHLLTSIDAPQRTGVCIDTCHLFACGYDFRSEKDYRATLEKLEDTVGVKNVFAFHLNDALNELGSRVDRHANIGEGNIGLSGFRPFLNDKRFASTPGYLETPLKGDKARPYASYETDLKTLRSLVKKK